MLIINRHMIFRIFIFFKLMFWGSVSIVIAFENPAEIDYVFKVNLIVKQHITEDDIHKVSEMKNKCNDNLDEWLKCNNTRVINYLKSLSDNNINKIVKGVLLSDGTKEMQGYVFLGKAKGLGKGIHLYIFEHKKKRSAYVWIDKNGTELTIPKCSEKVSSESAYVLSGDVYTWAAVQPGDDVVHIMCIDNSRSW